MTMGLSHLFARISLIVGLLIACIAQSEPVLNKSTTKQPKICLILKGGGALGIAHVGVLKVLEANKVPIHCVAGTSMGAIVGAAYASGLPVEDMERILLTTDWDAFFGEKISRQTRDYRLKPGRGRELFGDAKVSFDDGKLNTPAGLIQGQNIRPLFQGMFGDLPSPVDFDSLPIPFRAVTADIESGEKYIPAHGDLATIVRASMSVPGAFAPVEIDGRLVVDGGIANNLPVEVGIDFGADILIVVDLKIELAKAKDLTSPLSVTGQMVNLLLVHNAIESRKKVRLQDLVIEPDVRAFTALEFGRGKELIKVGEDTAQAMVVQIQRLSVSDADYEKFTQARTTRKMTPGIISFIRRKGQSRLTDEQFSKEMHLKVGDQFDRAKMEKDIQRLYQTGYYQSVQYYLIDEGGKQGVEVDVKDKEWLDNFYRIGFSLEDNLNGYDAFRLGLAYRFSTGLTQDGYGEAQVEIGKTPKLVFEGYQPLGKNTPYFINPIVGVGRTNVRLRQDGEEVGEYQRNEYYGTLNLGRKLGTSGEMGVGATRAHGELDRLVGDPLLPEAAYEVGDLTAGFELDTLDKADFPTEGYALTSRYRWSLEELGASSEFRDISGSGNLPITFGRNTFGLRVDYASTFGTRPAVRSYSLGGFGSVSGFTQNALLASSYVTGQVVGFRRFSEVQNPLFNIDFFLGGSFELTSLANDAPALEDENLISSGSVFFGGDTPLFPIYLGAGVADTGDRSIYIALGRIGRGTRSR